MVTYEGRLGLRLQWGRNPLKQGSRTLSQLVKWTSFITIKRSELKGMPCGFCTLPNDSPMSWLNEAAVSCHCLCWGFDVEDRNR